MIRGLTIIGGLIVAAVLVVLVAFGWFATEEWIRVRPVARFNQHAWWQLEQRR